MVSGVHIRRALAAFPELETRVFWLREKLASWPPASSARVLDALCEEHEREPTTEASRGALLPLALYVVRHRENEVVTRLSREASQHHLLSLGRLLRLPAQGPDPRPSEPLVPDYGAGRELTVGERRALARKPSRTALDRLLLDPHPLVIDQLLQNPKLVEQDIVRLVARRPVHLVALEQLIHSSRWMSRHRVRLALLFNPGTPPGLSLPFLGLCTRPELADMVRAPALPGVLRATALELRERRPPLRAVSSTLQ